MKNQTEVSRRLTLINAISNYGEYAIAIFVGIFLQAYLIRILGKDEYSLWPLISTCISFVGLIPIGIGAGASRFLAHALGNNNLEKAEQITTSLFYALLVATVVYATVVILLSIHFEQIFDIPAGTGGIGPWAMLLTGLSGAVAMPFGVFKGGLRAAQKFVALNSVQIITLILKLVLIVLIFTIHTPTLIWIGSVYLILEITNGIAIFLITKQLVPWNRVRLQSFNWMILWEVNNFSLLVLVSNASCLLYWKLDNIIINKFLDPVLLTGYSVVANFVLYSYRFTSLGASVLWPAATILYAKKDIARIRRLLFRCNRTVVPIAISALSFLMIYGPELLEIYVGPQYRKYAVLFLILGGGCIFSVTQNAAGMVPHAFGRLTLVTIISCIVAVANVILSIFFVVVLKWGLYGVAAGTAIVTIIHKTGFWPWYASNLLRMSWWKYLYESYLVPVGNCLPIVSVMLYLRLLGFGKGLIELVSIIIIGGIVEALYMLQWGLDKKDRKSIKTYLAKFAPALQCIVN